MDLLERPREVSSDWHVRQARALLRFDAGRRLDTTLLYAAFELRCAIERRFLEMLIMLRPDLDPEDVRRKRTRDGIDSLLIETDRFYLLTFEFTRIVASLEPGIPPLSAIDTKALRRLWGDLSEFCHFQARPEETFKSPGRAWQAHGFELLERALQKLSYTNLGVIQVDTMPRLTREIYDDFVARRIDAEQVRIRLRLVAP